MPNLKTCKADGKAMGLNTARWTFDARMDRADYLEFLKMYDEGDPILFHHYARPWLSGEWAGESPNELLGEGWTDRHAEAFEDAAEKAYWAELVRIAKFHTTD